MRLLGQWQVAENHFTLPSGQGLLVAPADPFRLAIHIGAVSSGGSAAGQVVVSTLSTISATNGVMLADHPVGRGLVYPLWGELVAQSWWVWGQAQAPMTITVTTVRAQQ
jgi:hypothetical protein